MLLKDRRVRGRLSGCVPAEMWKINVSVESDVAAGSKRAAGISAWLGHPKEKRGQWEIRKQKKPGQGVEVHKPRQDF